MTEQKLLPMFCVYRVTSRVHDSATMELVHEGHDEQKAREMYQVMRENDIDGALIRSDLTVLEKSADG